MVIAGLRESNSQRMQGQEREKYQGIYNKIQKYSRNPETELVT